MRDFHLPGRSTVYCQRAAIATSHPLATSAGLDVLRRGGNAVDAAICAAAVLAVVEPEQTGLGGDCFALLAPGSGGLHALDGSGWSPRAIGPELLTAQGHAVMPMDGPHSVTVPGAVDAWFRLLEDHGSWGMAEVLAPAIRLAEEGHPVHERVAEDWKACVEKLRRDPETAAIFLPQGRPPRPGEIFRQPLLAQSLREIGEGGRDAFYAGRIAEDMVARLRQLGGVHELDDFAEYRSCYRTPLAAGYRGMEIVQCPPASQGFTVLAMLRLLAALDVGADDPLSPRRLHLFGEAAKLAYAARNRLVADDPRSLQAALDWLGDDNIARLAAAIDPDRASPAPYPRRAGTDTVLVCAVDEKLNLVSLIFSIYQSYGSGIVAPRSGILLQNRGAGFALAEGHPNVLAGRKRPLHTIIPGMAMQDGRAVSAFGMVGGDFQPFGQAWLVSNVVDFGMSPQQAIDLARAFPIDDAFRLERGIAPETAEALERMGHSPRYWPIPLGSAQMIAIDRAGGVIAAGSDGRTDGCALGY